MTAWNTHPRGLDVLTWNSHVAFNRDDDQSYHCLEWVSPVPCHKARQINLAFAPTYQGARPAAANPAEKGELPLQSPCLGLFVDVACHDEQITKQGQAAIALNWRGTLKAKILKLIIFPLMALCWDLWSCWKGDLDHRRVLLGF